MLSAIQNALRIPDLRNRLLITFGLLVLYRFGNVITIPGVDYQVIADLIASDDKSSSTAGLTQIMKFASMVTGGNMRNCTLFALGIMPYISASIIFSLLMKIIPSLEKLSKDGENGRRIITRYTRCATVGLCLIQSFFIVGYLANPVGSQSLIIGEPSIFFWLRTILALTTGTVFLMWIGEQITEFGIGNGISIIIMAGIVAVLPPAIYQSIQGILAASENTNVPLEVLKFAMFIGLFIAVTVCVVIMQLGQRRVPIRQQKHTRGRRVYGGQSSHLPLKVNSAGVMPVIFAQSLLIIPSAILGLIPGLKGVAQTFASPTGFWYITLQIALVFGFTYFWTALIFSPAELAANLKEHGSFIPGIRPGRKTAEFLDGIMNRITLVGSAFLAFITVLPTLVGGLFNFDLMLAGFLGGTGILIVVGVALDVVQKIESHLLMRHYEGFMKAGRSRGKRK